MTPLAVLLTLLSLVQIAWTQIGYNANTNSLLCSKPGGHYCVHGSLQGPTMISCVSTTTAEIRSCNIELAHILPPGYKDMAICYETTPILGDALCAFNGTGYPRSGKPISVPETAICNDFPAGSSEDPDSNGDELSPEEAEAQPQPNTIDPHQHDHDHDPNHNQDPVAVPAPRKRADLEPETPVIPTTLTRTTTRPDNEKGSIQPVTPIDSAVEILPVIPTTSRPDNEKGTILPITPTDSMVDILPVTPPTTRPENEKGTIQPMPPVSTASQSDSRCAGQLQVRSRDPKATGSAYVTECVSGSMTLMPTLMPMPTPTPTPTFRRPRLADKCSWTPTPLHRTGAGVVRSSSTSSASGTESTSSPAATSVAKGSAVAFSVERAWVEVGFVMLAGWGVVLGLI